jgi:hypothetical protein
VGADSDKIEGDRVNNFVKGGEILIQIEIYDLIFCLCRYYAPENWLQNILFQWWSSLSVKFGLCLFVSK